MSAKDNTSKEMKPNSSQKMVPSVYLRKFISRRQSKKLSLVKRHGFSGLNSMTQTKQELLQGWLEVGKTNRSFQLVGTTMKQ